MSTSALVLWPMHGVEASQMGRGGIRAIAIATGVHPDTISVGFVRLSRGCVRPVGGRKRLAQIDPGLVAVSSALVDPVTRGDPMSALV